MDSNEVQARRLTDMWGWTLAALLGLLSLSLPRLLQMEVDRTTQFVVSESALFISGAIVGALRPERAWRWPMASLAAFIAADLFRLSDNPGHYAQFTVNTAGMMVADNLYNYVVFTLPVLVGAYAGAVMIKEGLE